MSRIRLPLLLLLPVSCDNLGYQSVENAPVRAAAVVSSTKYEGAGWTASSTDEAHWGWFKSPQEDFGMDWVLSAPHDCTPENPDLADWTDKLVDLDDDVSTLSSTNVDIVLDWDADRRLYSASESGIESAVTTFNLAETMLLSGTLAIKPFVIVPGEIPYFGPDPGSADSAALPELSLDQLEVSWSGNAADVVSVTGELLANNHVVLEHWTCSAQGDVGSVSIPSDLWDSANLDSATEVVFSISQHVVTSTRIDGMKAVSRGVGTRTRSAIYHLQQ